MKPCEQIISFYSCNCFCMAPRNPLQIFEVAYRLYGRVGSFPFKLSRVPVIYKKINKL